jgi:anthranilate synthase/aminodeoxychorismate synthase-like glutamine amidotransferase
MTVLILDNYDSFTYNLYQMVQAQTDQPVLVCRNNELDWTGLQTLNPKHLILSPGPGHPARASDFGICKTAIARQAELGCGILGVCLGHQGLIHHYGGAIVPAPEIMHGKTSAVKTVKHHPLLEGLPNPFTVMRYHSWMADPASLPPEFDILAETVELEPLIMAVAHQKLPLYGVQFHPESIGTPQGAHLLKNFLTLPAPSIEKSA